MEECDEEVDVNVESECDGTPSGKDLTPSPKPPSSCHSEHLPDPERTPLARPKRQTRLPVRFQDYAMSS